ncbi:MAG: LD-carboxypeptidase [Niastella sp. SCN 39-18]|nr:LD-carboxypeptidase [Sphingobacteriales bacterium]ODT55138.1 MAG: LD-carboxypeptidase [Niastella sp. SCN 39-18]OJW09151.1 MAG: LD-carboxypeptidase [Sphingobacteriales bacterium 39-19]
MKIKVPPYLQKDDIIGITCPAGYMAYEKARVCIETLQRWGFQVMVGKTLGSESTHYFSGTDEERRDEMQAMINDPSIKAILCGRGGYGASRIIDQINFKKLEKNPKWIIGFSDITVFHTHLFSKMGIASLHAPMAAAFNDDGYKNEYILSLKKALTGKKNKYTCNPHPFNNTGKATGKLIGGNLTLLANMIGTPSDYNTANCILFIEDIGEYLYSSDRLLLQLKRSGKFKKIKGLVLGGFTDTKDTDRPFGKSMDEILQEYTLALQVPVCFHFPVSHNKENVALKIGLNYTLQVTKNKVTLAEV